MAGKTRNPGARGQGTAEAEIRAQLADELRVSETLTEIGSLISTSNITDFYRQFVGKVRELIPCDRMVISIIDFELDTVTDRYIAGEIESDGIAGSTRKHSTSSSASVDTTELPNVFRGKAIEHLARHHAEWKERLDAASDPM